MTRVRRVSLLGVLLDTRLEYYAVTPVVRAVYAVALALVSLQCAFWGLAGWDLAGGRVWPLMGGGVFPGWLMMISTPAVWVGELAITRIICEHVVVVFRISEDVRELRQHTRREAPGKEKRAA